MDYNVRTSNSIEEQQVKYEILQMKKEIRNDKIRSAVMAGAGVVGSLVLHALMKNNPYHYNSMEDKVMSAMPSLMGISSAGATYYNSFLKQQQLNDLIESIRNNQSLEEFAKENGGTNYER
jgi:hypothetical protein